MIESILLWVGSALLLAFGGYIVAMNWLVFINNHILYRQWSSAIPLMGAIAISIALFLIPLPNLWKYSWLPFFIDWGSFPVIVAAIVLRFRKKGG
jgi:uncharacterized membrane protein